MPMNKAAFDALITAGATLLHDSGTHYAIRPATDEEEAWYLGFAEARRNQDEDATQALLKCEPQVELTLLDGHLFAILGECSTGE
jgi:hypothetical protein